MAAELFICGRRPLPPHEGAWELEIEGDDGGVDLSERADDVDYAAKVLGWTPVVVVRARKAWDNAQAVAEALATRLEGAVFCDVDCEVLFDAKGKAEPAASMDALEDTLCDVFGNPEPYFERWRAAEHQRWAASREGRAEKALLERQAASRRRDS